MISDTSNQRQAFYDENRNIVLPDSGDSVDSQELKDEQVFDREQEEVIWAVVEEEEIESTEQVEQKVSITEKQKEIWHEVRKRTQDTVQEGMQQYRFSFRNFLRSWKEMLAALRNEETGLKAFLTQPVWIVTPNKAPKQYSRGTLFVLDVFRFGGTFAIIFGGLFVSLNYESFWQIFSEKLNPLQHAQQISGQNTELDEQLRANLLKSPTLATAGNTKGHLLSYLPDVGPPHNRIIIPKLGLNIPLVTPSYESLLKEDWDKVEEDIQDALKHGVVHYPGTARPGQAGNFFVTGHSSYYPWAEGLYKTIFARLHNLNVGDEYYVYYGGDKHRYVISSKKEVKPSNVDVLDQPLNRRMSTLMTCSPVGTTLRRLILTAQEIDVRTGIPLEVGEQQEREVVRAKPAMLPI